MFTDLKSLKYIFTQPKLNLRKRRCMELVAEANLDFIEGNGTEGSTPI